MFIFFKSEKEKHWYEREALIGCLLYPPWLGMEPVPLVCALTGDQTPNPCNPLVYGMMLQPVELSSQGCINVLYVVQTILVMLIMTGLFPDRVHISEFIKLPTFAFFCFIEFFQNCNLEFSVIWITCFHIFIFWIFFIFFMSCLVTLVIRGIWWIPSLSRLL